MDSQGDSGDVVMMDLFVRALSMCLGCVRMCLGIWVALSPQANTVAVLFGVFEALGGALASLNAGLAIAVDRRIVGLLAPIAYTMGAYVVCSPGGSPTILAWGLMGVWALRMWAMGSLGLGYSVGSPAWVALADRGLFAWVRHPMAATGIAARMIFCLANPEPWNFFCLGVMAQAALVSVWVEESFLRQFDEWRAYAKRVRWRFLPGVW